MAALPPVPIVAVTLVAVVVSLARRVVGLPGCANEFFFDRSRRFPTVFRPASSGSGYVISIIAFEGGRWLIFLQRWVLSCMLARAR